MPSVTRLSAPTSTPHFSANLSAAAVGLPSLPKAAFTGGPFSLIACAACADARPLTCTASRRGVANERIARVRQRSFDQCGAQSCGEGSLELGQRQRWQFFGAELDQEIARCAHATPASFDAAVFGSIGKPSASRLS